MKSKQLNSINHPNEFEKLGAEQKRTLNSWIRSKFTHSSRGDKDIPSSYGLKHWFQEETGIYVTNGAFKGAMLDCGFDPVDRSAVNWRFKIIHSEKASEDEQAQTKQSGVYFIQQGNDGPIKIGYAADVEKRLATLQVGNPTPLNLLGVHKGTMKTEKELHKRFAEHRLSGEWFVPTPEIYNIAFGGCEERAKKKLSGEYVEFVEQQVQMLLACGYKPLDAKETVLDMPDPRHDLDGWHWWQARWIMRAKRRGIFDEVKFGEYLRAINPKGA